MGARMCPCLLAGQRCVDVTLDNKPEVDDEMEMDTPRQLKVIKMMELNCRSSVLRELRVVANNG